MFKPAAFIGLRYAMARSRSQLVSFISLVSILGMMLGVGLLIVVLSIMNGFEREMQQRILGLVPHVTISAYGEGVNWEGIEAKAMSHSQVKNSAPFIKLNAMMMRADQVDGVLVYGVYPEKEQQVSIVEEHLPKGSLTQLIQSQTGIIIGSGLAEKFDLKAGDPLNLMVVREKPGQQLPPRFQRFNVVAVFDSGTEVDQVLALIPYDQAAKLSDFSTANRGLRLSLKDSLNAQQVAWELEHSLPYGFIASDWTRSHGNLYSAIQLSRQLVGLMLLTIIAVAAFNVVSALVMVVNDKRGDIAILRTMGASPGMILTIFLLHGTVIGLMGAFLGAVLGVSLSWIVTDLVVWVESSFGMQFLNTDVYPVDYVPVDLRWSDVAMVCGVGFVMSMLATLFPSWRAAKVQPAQALRYD
jgi:lipoprotein-releasing system permease protein